jgi:hypothetical protein
MHGVMDQAPLDVMSTSHDSEQAGIGCRLGRPAFAFRYRRASGLPAPSTSGYAFELYPKLFCGNTPKAIERAAEKDFLMIAGRDQ